MRKIYIATLLALTSLAACNQKDSTEAPNKPTQTTESASKSSPNTPTTPSAKIAPEYAEFAALTQAAKDKLANATPEQANEIYAEHRKAVAAATEELTKKEEKFLGEQYHNEENWQQSENEDEPSIPKGEVKARMDKLASVGLVFFDEGEGIVSIRQQPDYFKNLFAGKVTPDVAEFIDLNANDDKKPVENDAAIIVPWAELGDRAFAWESFIKKYPDSAYAKEAKEQFQHYADSFLFGMDNTPVEASTNPDLKDVAQEYQKIEKTWSDFAKAHPNSSLMPLFDEARQIAKMEQNNGQNRYDTITKFRKEKWGMEEN